MKLDQLSYPDFVALMRQENTPPGGGATVNEWVEHSRIQAGSTVLDLACSTGFSSRHIAKEIPIDAVGIDISASAVKVANEKATGGSYLGRLRYLTMDATHIEGIGPFSHVLAGCNFGFIQDRKVALTQVGSCLELNGFMCTANFHYISRPPTAMLDRVESALGWRPAEEWTLDFWTDFFSDGFELFYSRIAELPVLSEERLRDVIALQFNDPELRVRFEPDELRLLRDRYYYVRNILNEHRRYQGFSVQIWRKN